MHETVAMREPERSRDVDDDVRGAVGMQPPLGAQDLREAAAFDVLHHDEVGAVLFAPVEDADDVRMVEVGRRLRLATEALHERGIRRVLREQHLHRDGAIE
jgi:hypothetical protein